VLVFSPAAGSPKYGVQGIGNLAFTMGEAASAEGVINADWAMQKGYKSTYELLDTTLAFTKSHCQGFDSRWTQNGGTVVGKDTFANGDPSIQAQITRLSSASTKPDFIEICSYPPGGVTAIKQIRSAGITTPIVVNSSFDGSYWLSSVPGLSSYYQNAYGSYFGNDPRAEVNNVAARLKANPTSSDNSLALTGYAVIEAFARAAEKAGTLDGQSLRMALETNHFDTILGPTLYSATNHIANADREMAVITIDNSTRGFVTLYASKNPPPLDYTSG
jgi:branched-chain amino acid transport system substrate-binding protein